ncbi:MAG: SGNH/GDSL hydrolase family protein [Aliishimia sp.]
MALDTVLSILLSPLLLAQTAWTLRSAERLPEPTGDRFGLVGQGPHLRFLQLGDSSCVGVGVASQHEALAPKLSSNLGDVFSVSWTLIGENGATTEDAARLLEPIKHDQFDAAYVIFGVNDVKNLRRIGHWRRDYRKLIDILKDRHGVQIVYVSGLPPVGEFPLMPNPLRFLFSMRARRFDRALQCVTKDISNCHHLPISAGLNPAYMASDGFHPGEGMYSEWADVAAAQMLPKFAKLNLTSPNHPNHKAQNNNDHIESDSACQ